jgi:hypothetical protein
LDLQFLDAGRRLADPRVPQSQPTASRVGNGEDGNPKRATLILFPHGQLKSNAGVTKRAHTLVASADDGLSHARMIDGPDRSSTERDPPTGIANEAGPDERQGGRREHPREEQ